MQPEVLARVMNWAMSVDEYRKLTPAFNKALAQAGCTNVARAAMFCAQLGHESVGLSAMEEYASGEEYEWRGDLGNVYPGDGVRYKGRGPIQITGRANYENLSQWAFAQGYVPYDTYFVDNPTLLSGEEFGFLGAVWYWTVARPKLNQYADGAADPNLNGVDRYDNFVAATKAINGGTNGIADRQMRFDNALIFGNELLPEEEYLPKDVEKVLDYNHGYLPQDTGYYCGPASTQTVVWTATKILYAESELATWLNTTFNGTDYIGQFIPVLNSLIQGGNYTFSDMPNDPPTWNQKQKLWEDITGSIDAGYAAIANIVAPPSNYPIGTRGSTTPSYGGGEIYHYIAVVGYAIDNGVKHYAIADSGFWPYEYWISHEQLATLIPPKGYAYSANKVSSSDDILGDVALSESYTSRVNPNVSFPASNYMLFNDERSFHIEAMLRRLLKVLDEDPDTVIRQRKIELGIPIV